MLCQMIVLLVFLEISGIPAVPGNTTRDQQTHLYTVARDYQSIHTENYPGVYPSKENYTWEWSAASGYWRIFFVDFKLACESSSRTGGDVLTIVDDFASEKEGRKLLFHCLRTQMEKYSHTVKGARFQIHLASHVSDPAARGFLAKVLYGETTDIVESKISQLKAAGTPSPPDGDSSLSVPRLVVILIVVIIVILVVGFGVGCCVLLQRRRHHQQTTNTSVHFSIGEIRRESSISYSRQGNGPQASGPRSRMNSDESTTADNGNAGRARGRPVVRTESNTSWAMRAEMATQPRLGSNSSSSSEAGNRPCTQATAGSKRLNCYTPFPERGASAESGSCSDSSGSGGVSGDAGTDPEGLLAATSGPDRKQQSGRRCGYGGREARTAEHGALAVVRDDEVDAERVITDEDDVVFEEEPPGVKKKKNVNKQLSKKKKKEGRNKDHVPAQPAHESRAWLTLSPPSTQAAEDAVDDGSRLSTISEESRSSASVASKLRVAIPLPKLYKAEPSLAIANSGYILMTGCAAAKVSATYVNCDAVSQCND